MESFSCQMLQWNKSSKKCPVIVGNMGKKIFCSTGLWDLLYRLLFFNHVKRLVSKHVTVFVCVHLYFSDVWHTHCCRPCPLPFAQKPRLPSSCFCWVQAAIKPLLLKIKLKWKKRARLGNMTGSQTRNSHEHVRWWFHTEISTADTGWV